MTRTLERVADAVLYEGYRLYPYGGSALKNQQYWGFGELFPTTYSAARAGNDPSDCRVELLLRAAPGAQVDVSLRCLQAMERSLATGAADGRELARRQLALGSLDITAVIADSGAVVSFELPAGDLVREGVRRRWSRLQGRAEVSARRVDAAVVKLTLRVVNDTPLPASQLSPREAAQHYALLAAHLVLGATDGAFVSMIDPPEDVAAAAAACRSERCWPVLVGPAGATDRVLCAPIILYDYPQVAAASPGDGFDSLEIDEMLVLHVLTLAPEERADAMRDPAVAEMIRRTEALGPEAVRALHAEVRVSRAPSFAVGDAVRIRPDTERRADIIDTTLAGRRATVCGVEVDLSGRVHVAVTVDDDPGADIGPWSHRFFFAPDELEAVAASPPRRVLVGGIGNIFLGDDGFGVAVAQRLLARELPAHVDVVDFGIRGRDLAYAMLDDYAQVILIDTTQRGADPGTVYVIAPTERVAAAAPVDPHTLTPDAVFAQVTALGGDIDHVTLVCCEPQTFAPGDGSLSPAVAAAIDPAVAKVEELLNLA